MAPQLGKSGAQGMSRGERPFTVHGSENHEVQRRPWKLREKGPPNTVYRLGQRQDKALNKVVAASQDMPITTVIGHSRNIRMKDGDWVKILDVYEESQIYAEISNDSTLAFTQWQSHKYRRSQMIPRGCALWQSHNTDNKRKGFGLFRRDIHSHREMCPSMPGRLRGQKNKKGGHRDASAQSWGW